MRKCVRATVFLLMTGLLSPFRLCFQSLLTRPSPYTSLPFLLLSNVSGFSFMVSINIMFIKSFSTPWLQVYSYIFSSYSILKKESVDDPEDFFFFNVICEIWLIFVFPNGQMGLMVSNHLLGGSSGEWGRGVAERRCCRTGSCQPAPAWPPVTSFPPSLSCISLSRDWG